MVKDDIGYSELAVREGCAGRVSKNGEDEGIARQDCDGIRTLMRHTQRITIPLKLKLHYAAMTLQRMYGSLMTPVIDQALQTPTWQIQQNWCTQRPRLFHLRRILCTGLPLANVCTGLSVINKMQHELSGVVLHAQRDPLTQKRYPREATRQIRFKGLTEELHRRLQATMAVGWRRGQVPNPSVGLYTGIHVTDSMWILQPGLQSELWLQLKWQIEAYTYNGCLNRPHFISASCEGLGFRCQSGWRRVQSV